MALKLSGFFKENIISKFNLHFLSVNNTTQTCVIDLKQSRG